MRILVTRPSPDGERTASRLAAMGHSAVLQPLMRLELLPLATDIDPVAIAVTSRNGIRALASWPAASAWLDRPLFAVGATTASAATAARFTDVRSADGDGRMLAELISAQLDPAAGTVLHPAAEDRSAGLSDGLARAGFRVEVIVAYRMVASDTLGPDVIEALEIEKIEGVLLYSKRSADIFLALLDKAGLADILRRLPVFALSPSVASAFLSRSDAHIEIAAAPREDALLRLLPTG